MSFRYSCSTYGTNMSFIALASCQTLGEFLALTVHLDMGYILFLREFNLRQECDYAGRVYHRGAIITNPSQIARCDIGKIMTGIPPNIKLYLDIFGLSSNQQQNWFTDYFQRTPKSQK